MSAGTLDQEAILDLGSGPTGPFRVDANTVVTGRTCVLGSSGSGKSYAVGVLCEELCLNEVPFAIIDTEGEHTGLKEKFDTIWVGDEDGSDIRWDEADLSDLAAQAPDIAPLILDVSGLADAREKVSRFVEALYQTLTERRTPYLLVVEEADKFVPQLGVHAPIFSEVARRGRKRGLGLMICSQRPSLVDKNVLSQCGNQLIGKLIIQNDLQSVSQFFPGKGLPRGLTALRAGEFYAMGGFSPTPALVTIKRRTTKPGGVTPALGRRTVKKYVGQGAKTGAAEVEGEGAPVKAGRVGVGLSPTVSPDDVPIIVRRERSFGIFGPKETVTGVDLQFRTMVQLGVRMRRGLLKRRYETVYLLLDGTTGKEVRVERGLAVGRGFEKLLGLTTLQVEVLREVMPGTDTSALDIASRLGESKATVTRALNQLNDKRLVRTIEVRRKKLFRRLVDLPPEPSELVPLELDEVDLGKTKVTPPKLKEQDVRDAVKGLWEGSDVESFETFHYPVFRVELVVRRKHRQVLLDGRSGKELAF
jgi:DNA-binding MarR family transcriptional regulator